MYLADNVTTTIVMENFAQSVTARDFINKNLELKNNSELSKIANAIGNIPN